MKSYSTIGISFISESPKCPEMPLLTDQYSIVVLRKFGETSETLLFLISKPVFCQTHIILKTQRPCSGGWRETNSRNRENPQQLNFQGWERRRPPALCSCEVSYKQVNLFQMTVFEFQHSLFLSPSLSVFSYLWTSRMGRDWMFAFWPALLHPWLLRMPEAVAQVTGNAAKKESFEEFEGENAGDSSSQVSNAMTEMSLI